MTELRNSVMLFVKTMEVIGKINRPDWDTTIFIIHLVLLSLAHTVASTDKIFSE